MGTAKATTTKGGGEGRYNDDTVDSKQCDEEGQGEVGNEHGGEEKK